MTPTSQTENQTPSPDSGAVPDSSVLRRQSPAESRKSVSCRNCRARKVKCDRHQPNCVRCNKLSLQCSYASKPAPGTLRASLAQTDEDGTGPLTQAGIQRRRIRRACVSCRSHKAKCSGSQPCGRCDSHELSCIYPNDSGRPRAPVQAAFASPETGDDTPTSQLEAEARVAETDNLPPAESNASNNRVNRGNRLNTISQDSRINMSSANLSPMSDVRPSLGNTEQESTVRLEEPNLSNRTFVRYCVDAYFANVDPSHVIFLHKASFLSTWHQGNLDPTLLKIVCASGLRLTAEHRDPGSIPFTWAREVQDGLLKMNALDGRSSSALQALVMLIRFHFASHFAQDAWLLLAVAARAAFTMRLNYEPSASASLVSGFEVVRRECMRRLMWAIFILDKLFSGGIEDLTVCPSHRLHIRLPCSNDAFQRGLVPNSPFLQDRSSESITSASGGTMDAVGYRIKLFDLRDRIFRYTRRIILEGSIPSQSEAELQALDNELQQFRNALPLELQLNPERLVFMAHSEESTPYIMLHSMWLLCRCDLHRFLIPGIREGVRSEVLSRTPRSFIDHCQQICFDTASVLCDLFDEVHEIGACRQINSASLAITLYQCVQIFDHLAFRMPRTGPHSLEEVKRKLFKGLSLASHLGSTHNWLRPCIADIEKLVPNLGRRRRIETTLADSSSRSFPHTRSKHVFAPTPRPGSSSRDSLPEDGLDVQVIPSSEDTNAQTVPHFEATNSGQPLSVTAPHSDSQWDQATHRQRLAQSETFEMDLGRDIDNLRRFHGSQIEPANPVNSYGSHGSGFMARGGFQGGSELMGSGHAPSWGDHIPGYTGTVGQATSDVDLRSMDPLELVLNSYSDAEPVYWPTSFGEDT